MGRRNVPVPRRIVGAAETAKMTTGKKPASQASKELSNPKSSKAEKSVAASDLSQAKGKGSNK